MRFCVMGLHGSIERHAFCPIACANKCSIGRGRDVQVATRTPVVEVTREESLGARHGGRYGRDR